MNQILNSLFIVLCLSFTPLAEAKTALPKTTKTQNLKPSKKEKPVPVIIETSEGNIKIELNKEKAPISVQNFLNYVDKKFYDNLVFHRVIDNFMIQGGGFDKDIKLKTPDASIKNEANNGLKNDIGTISMARTPNPDSASSQFFINLKANDFLNYKGPLPADYGYAVFGKVTAGMDIVSKIGKVQTTAKGQMRDVPAKPVIIKTIRRAEKEN